MADPEQRGGLMFTMREPQQKKEQAPRESVTLTEEQACADCQHQIYDHQGGKCRVRRSDGEMCDCKGFRFMNEGRPQ